MKKLSNMPMIMGLMAFMFLGIYFLFSTCAVLTFPPYVPKRISSVIAEDNILAFIISFGISFFSWILAFILSFFGKEKFSDKTGILTIICGIFIFLNFILFGYISIHSVFNLLGSLLYIISGSYAITNNKIIRNL